MELRLYAFGNYYLSQIQQGIQALHATMELQSYYGINLPRFDDEKVADDMILDHSNMLTNNMIGAARRFENWRQNHKTVVLLNGGNSKDLKDLYSFILSEAHSHDIPFAMFHEDTQSLNCALTSVCCVLPEKIFEANTKYGCYRKENAFESVLRAQSYSPWEIELVNRLSTMRLA